MHYVGICDMTIIYCINFDERVRVPVHSSVNKMKVGDVAKWLRDFADRESVHEVWYGDHCVSRWEVKETGRWGRMSSPSSCRVTDPLELGRSV